MNISTKETKLHDIVNKSWNTSILKVGEDILIIQNEKYIFQIYGYTTGGDERKEAEYIEMNFAEKDYFNTDKFDVMPIETEELDLCYVKDLDYYGAYSFFCLEFFDHVQAAEKLKKSSLSAVTDPERV